MSPRGSDPRLRFPVRSSPGFVRRQLSLAAEAFHLGEIGAACAALRVLRSEDFADRQRAAEWLARMRRYSDGLEARSRAVEELLRLGRSLPVRRSSESDSAG